MLPENTVPRTPLHVFFPLTKIAILDVAPENMPSLLQTQLKGHFLHEPFLIPRADLATPSSRL